MADYNIPNSPEATQSSMQTFWAKAADKGGLAKSCRFIIRILPGPSTAIAKAKNIIEDLPFLCESAEFPGRGFINTDLRYYGPNFKAPLQTTYEDLNLTFLCRDEFAERQFFDSWMEVINPSATYNFTYPEQYLATIEIYQLSDISNNSKYKFTFQKAWPVLINPQPVTWADDNFHRLTVSFTYTRWIREELDTKGLPGYDELVAKSKSARDGYGSIIPLFDVNVKNG